LFLFFNYISSDELNDFEKFVVDFNSADFSNIKTAEVKDISLKRDAVEFLLHDGKIFIIKPILGKEIAVYFQGNGEFIFASNTKIEQDNLKRLYPTDKKYREFTSMFIVFADSTLQRLENKLIFTETDFFRKWKD